MRFPIIARSPNFLGSPRNEVPPQQDRFSDCQAANEQHARAVGRREAQVDSRRAQVVPDSGRQRLFLQGAIAAEYQDRMFVFALDRNVEESAIVNPVPPPIVAFSQSLRFNDIPSLCGINFARSREASNNTKQKLSYYALFQLG